MENNILTKYPLPLRSASVSRGIQYLTLQSWDCVDQRLWSADEYCVLGRLREAQMDVDKGGFQPIQYTIKINWNESNTQIQPEMAMIGLISRLPVRELGIFQTILTLSFTSRLVIVSGYPCVVERITYRYDIDPSILFSRSIATLRM